MNTWQILRQIKYKLEALEWIAGRPVFGSGSVIPTAGASSAHALLHSRSPVATIFPLGERPNPDHPGLLLGRVGLRLFVAQADDELGERSLIGANWADLNSSQGRGLLEIEEQVKSVLRQIGRDSGMSIVLRAAGAAQAASDENLPYVLTRSYDFEVDCTDEREYFPVSGFLADNSVAGQLDLSWRVPPDRYDRKRVHLEYSLGSTPPASPGSGTEITLSSALATSYSHTGLGNGTQVSYSLWVYYDDRVDPPIHDRELSAAVTVTATTT